MAADIIDKAIAETGGNSTDGDELDIECDWSLFDRWQKYGHDRLYGANDADGYIDLEELEVAGHLGWTARGDELRAERDGDTITVLAINDGGMGVEVASIRRDHA